MPYKKRFEIIEGNAKVLTILINDGWELVNTFPNPHPMPIFYALVKLEIKNEKFYDLKNVEDHVYRESALKQWREKLGQA